MLMPMIADRFVTATVGASLRFWLVVITPLVMAILLMQMSVTRTDIVFSSCYVRGHRDPFSQPPVFTRCVTSILEPRNCLHAASLLIAPMISHSSPVDASRLATTNCAGRISRDV